MFRLVLRRLHPRGRAPCHSPRYIVKVQEECGVNIGEDYPYPIVNYEQQRREARDEWSKLDSRAKEALELPSVFKNASLSDERRNDLKSDSDEDGQTKISDFE